MIHSLMVSKSIQFLFFLCTLAFLSQVAFADPPYEICSTSSSYANGSSFQSNLRSLLLSLPSNASISKSYNTSSGFAPDGVYVLYMCLNYVSNETCHKCITTAIGDIVKLCPQSKEAVVWEEFCQLRYSNNNFLGRLNVTGNIGLDNKLNLSEPEKFESAVNKILNNLTEVASFNVSSKKYATGEVPYEDKTIYALVQCTRDLSANDCSICLKSAIREIPEPNSTGSLISNNEGKNNSSKIWMITAMVVVVGLVLIIFVCFMYFVRNKRNRQSKNGIDKISKDFPFIDLGSIRVATKNFSDSNMLGQGGFGPVYKGILSDGQEVAIKRLSTCSEQGSEEFINEVMLIMKLQHKNLVKLLGFCVDGEEKILVYEFLPNGSLDAVLFDDPKQKARLDWNKRLDIINGIAKGILYLHEDSRLKIIHRDLKASNVLLDSDMNPKISDFGMARIFAGSEGEANTATIVGTYGYMAPEYAMEGLYSIKSDVFGFGVLLLEIITGKRNAGFYHSKNAPSLLAYVSIDL
ncbi:Serine-threonine/tyrosine-protein kinase, catalytic domain [Sesbania bispinosa]|nr:Serine-threonine/tyrosine-protein kinase, catalytic domain [Sesbania bispinosa]